MHITFSPVRRDGRPTISRKGDALIIDGETFDFSGVPDGATLPAEAVASEWVTGAVSRIGGVLQVELMLSHGAAAPPETLDPAPVRVIRNGAVVMPPYEQEQTE